MERTWESVVEKVSSILTPGGFEIHPFKISWYNVQCAHAPFHLQFNPDTLAIVVISTPDMFDKSFKPFVCRQECLGVRDPIDECMAKQFREVKEAFPDVEVTDIHDYEVDPATRRPRVLVQTAAHVAGAARYYQRSDVVDDPWDKKQKIFGVSVHPVYGGWFAMRGVLIFKDILCPELQQKQPVDILQTDELKIELLKRYNFQWKDWTFRDIIPVEKKYSEEQKKYFETCPKDRLKLIQEMDLECNS